MATQDYNVGTPLGPDPRAVQDLEAIDTYVRTQARPRIAQWPDSLAQIQDYEKWRQGLSWWIDMFVMVNDTMRTAKNKRDAINVAQHNVLPETAVVEPGAFVSPPPLPKKPGPSGFQLLLGGGLIGAVAAAIVFWRKR